MKKLTFFFLLCLLWNCNSSKHISQQSSCGNNFEIQYDKSGKYLLPTKERDKNYLIFYFESNFNDNIKININNKEIFNKQVITNDKKPDDYSEKVIFKMGNENNYKMNIQGESSKTCLELPINTEYRMIYLYYHNNRWIVRFSNNIRIN